MSPSSAGSPDSLSHSPIIDQAIRELEVLFRQTGRAKEGLAEVALTAGQGGPRLRESIEKYTEDIAWVEERVRDMLYDLLLNPPCHSRHLGKLEAFHGLASREASVFIMTKFPEGDSAKDGSLNRVINAVSSSIDKYGFYPRLASDADYHGLLWDNVELYLLGCSRGVAIVEDQYMPELNPNVAMEWGWMRGMGKHILFLVEESFQHFRADWGGLTRYSFSWHNPEAAIEEAIRKWLKPPQ